MRAWGTALMLVWGSALPAKAQSPPPSPPPSGWSLGLSIGPSWSSNPRDVSTRTRGDVYLGNEIALGYRLPLWEGGAIAFSMTGTTELYARETQEGIQRGAASLSVSHNWSGTILSLSASARKTMGHDFARHDSASQEIGIGITRSFAIAEGWSLILFARGARRYLNDGTEDQIRAGLNATLVYRTGPWSVRLGGGFGYALEDKTILLPRINDRTVSARAGLGYEWAKDREIAFGGAFTRTYSSYAPNRTKAYSLSPRISATLRF